MGRVLEVKGKFQYTIVTDAPKFVISHLRFNLKGIIFKYNAKAKKFAGKKFKPGRMFVRGNQAIVELDPGIHVNVFSKVLEEFVNYFEWQNVGVYLPFWK